jgi:DNA-binding FrmR family transcriptional regulator
MSHVSDPKIQKSLKQARGHIESILTMYADGRSCLDLAQQLQAAESIIRSAKRALIHDHMEHCVADAVADGGMTAEGALRVFKSLAKYL